MEKVDQLIQQVHNADAIIVGAGSGMSNAAGMDFWYEASPLFMKEMDYFYNKYHFAGIFKGYYNRFDSEEERWAFLLKSLKMIYTIPPQKPTYEYLKTLIGDKPTHYVTTNQDGLFKKFFPADQVSEIQGSWSWMQSQNTKTDKHLYDALKIVHRLLPQVKNHRLAKDLFPTSPVDGSPLVPWIRGPEFLEDQRYYDEYHKWNHFLAQHRGEKILFLEMGVGRMTPMFIQEPFWEMTAYMKNSYYVNINPKDAMTNPTIQDRSLLISEDINEALKDAAAKVEGGKNE